MIGPQHQIPVDDDAHRQAGSFGQRRLHVHVAPGHLLAYLVHRILQAVASGDDHAVAPIAILRCGQLGADAQQGGQRGASEHAIPVPIHPIFQTRIAGWIGADQFIELERGRIREDHPIPHDLHAALPIADLAVVFAQQARALRDQHVLAGGRVVDRLGHRGDHIARQVGLDARDQRSGDHRTGHDLIRRCGHL